MSKEEAEDSVIEELYDSNFPIDKHALDEEWMNQPTLYQFWSKKLGKAQTLVGQWKDHLEFKKAELDKQIRGDFKISGEKFTETSLLSSILTHDEYQAALGSYNDALSDMRELSAIVASLDQRKTALENLVKLYGQQYFSNPYVSDKDKENFTGARAMDQTKKHMKRS